MNDFCFVLLHYQTIDDTKRCVASIKALSETTEIVIVDNNSSNGTGNQLKEFYRDDAQIHVILNEENVGFARGNNIGYKWAREHLNSKFIACVNNDTVIQNKNFIYLIKDYYAKKTFDVLGIDVFNPVTGVHQSPIRNRCLNKRELHNEIIKNRKHFIMILLKKTIRHFWADSDKRMESNKKSSTSKTWKYESENVVIHGAAVIYGKHYIQNEPEAFNSNTFLYYEEDLLALFCKKKGYKIRYYPGIQILHYEGQSSDSISSDYYKRTLYKIIQAKRSLRFIQKWMQYNELRG
jgi:GT2 family glycosyltransferase